MTTDPPSAPPAEPSFSGRAGEPPSAPSFDRAPPPAGPGEAVPVAPSFPEVQVRFSRLVARWVRLYGVAKKDRPDVVQEAWVRIERALPSYRPELPIEPWLCTIVRHTAHDHMERAYVRCEVLSSKAGRRIAVDVEPRVQRKLDAEALLARVLATIPDEEWEVFVLVEVEGVPCTEVAASLGVPVGTVHSRLRRARLHLAETLTRMVAGERKRRNALIAPAFLVAWRERWSRWWGWLRHRFVAGALTGGAVVYWLLGPASPGGANVAATTADAKALPSMAQPSVAPPASARGEPAASAPLEAAPVPGAAARDRRAASTEGEAGARALVRGARPAAPGLAVRSAAGRRREANEANPSPGSTEGGAHTSEGGANVASEGDLSAETVAILGVAQALLRNGECGEARRRLAPHAERLARGPLAREYEAIVRELRSCPR